MPAQAGIQVVHGIARFVRDFITKRLTADMFDAIMRRARELLQAI